MAKFVDPIGFAEWEATVPPSLRRGTIWRTPAYRYGLWLADLAKADARRLFGIREVSGHADQLVRAVGGISSNLAEGYACASGADRARYYGYALTSSHEAIDWYAKVREELGVDIVEQRCGVLDRVIRILTVAIPRERRLSRRRPLDTLRPRDHPP